MLSLFHLHWGTYSVHVVVQVWWKYQCVSASVEVSVFKGFSERTLRNAFGNYICHLKEPRTVEARSGVGAHAAKGAAAPPANRLGSKRP